MDEFPLKDKRYDGFISFSAILLRGFFPRIYIPVRSAITILRNSVIYKRCFGVTNVITS